MAASSHGGRFGGRRMSQQVQSQLDRVVIQRYDAREEQKKRRSVLDQVKQDFRRASKMITNTLLKFSDEDAALKMYTSREIERHATAEDCWVVLHGRVYDVTGWIKEHPGGPLPIAEQAGGDVTELFELIFHSEHARRTLGPFLVGRLAGAPLGDLFAAADPDDGAANRLFYFVAFLFLLLGLVLRAGGRGLFAWLGRLNPIEKNM